MKTEPTPILCPIIRWPLLIGIFRHNLLPSVVICIIQVLQPYGWQKHFAVSKTIEYNISNDDGDINESAEDSDILNRSLHWFMDHFCSVSGWELNRLQAQQESFLAKKDNMQANQHE